MMGAFPNLSRNVPFCPRLSSFVLLGAWNRDKSRQKRTNGDKKGHFGTNWETPPFSIYPHLALLNYCPSVLKIFGAHYLKEIPFSFLPPVWRHPPNPRNTPAKKAAFPLGNRSVLRSQEGHVLRREMSWGGDGVGMRQTREPERRKLT